MTKLIFAAATAAAAIALGSCQGERAENAAEGRTEVLEEQAVGAADEAPLAQATAVEAEGEASTQTSNDSRQAAAPIVQASPSSPAGTSASTRPNPANGSRIYSATCVACHGSNGKGMLPGMPDLTAANGRLAKSDAILLRNIIQGFQSPGSPLPMPARGGNPDLTDQDMANVLAYMRTAFER